MDVLRFLSGGIEEGLKMTGLCKNLVIVQQILLGFIEIFNQYL